MKQVEKKKTEEAEDESSPSDQKMASSMHSSPSRTNLAAMENSEHGRRGFFGRKKQLRSVRRADSAESNEIKSDRPAFSVMNNVIVSNRKQSRAVAIPYSRLRKERFYDWPPDPTVSRATPLAQIFGPGYEPEVVDKTTTGVSSLSLSTEDTTTLTEPSLRRRHQARTTDSESDIPRGQRRARRRGSPSLYTRNGPHEHGGLSLPE